MFGQHLHALGNLRGVRGEYDRVGQTLGDRKAVAFVAEQFIAVTLHAVTPDNGAQPVDRMVVTGHAVILTWAWGSI